MAEVDAGAAAPIENVVTPPAADAVPAPDAPVVQDNADTPEKPQPKYTDEDLSKRISERLAKERRRLERVVRAEMERDHYKQQLEARNAPQQQPQPKGRPKQSDFEGRPFDEYLDAVTDWKLEQREAKRREESQRETAQERQTRAQAEQARDVHEKVIKAGQKKYPDFDDVVMADDMPISPAMVAAASRLANGADALYQLCKSEEIARIAQLSDIEQVWELRDFASKLSAPPKPTSAPPPIVPNNSQSKGTKDWKEMSTKEHVESWLNRKKR